MVSSPTHTPLPPPSPTTPAARNWTIQHWRLITPCTHLGRKDNQFSEKVTMKPVHVQMHNTNTCAHIHYEIWRHELITITTISTINIWASTQSKHNQITPVTQDMVAHSPLGLPRISLEHSRHPKTLSLIHWLVHPLCPGIWYMHLLMRHFLPSVPPPLLLPQCSHRDRSQSRGHQRAHAQVQVLIDPVEVVNRVINTIYINLQYNPNTYTPKTYCLVPHHIHVSQQYDGSTNTKSTQTHFSWI